MANNEGELPKQLVADKNGDTMALVEVNGVYYPCLEEYSMYKALVKKPPWTSRPDDVVVASFPKSGTNWVFYIIHMLLHGEIEFAKDMWFLFSLSAEKYESLPSPRLTVSHLPFEEMPEDFVEKGGKVIYVLRNPKDVAVSGYHFAKRVQFYEYNGKFDGYLDMFMKNKTMYGSWFTHVKDWEIAASNNKNILMVKYEDLIKRPMQVLQSMQSFLGLSHSNDFLTKVYHESQFDNMRTQLTQTKTFFWDKYSEDGKNPIFRQGKIGNWKNKLTVQQNEDFDLLFSKEMKNSQLIFDFE